LIGFASAPGRVSKTAFLRCQAVEALGSKLRIEDQTVFLNILNLQGALHEGRRTRNALREGRRVNRTVPEGRHLITPFMRANVLITPSTRVDTSIDPFTWLEA